MSLQSTPSDLVLSDIVMSDSTKDKQSDDDYRLNELPEQYELLGKISQGGMGAILKARNRHTGALFAIKVMRTDVVQKRNALERFKKEAKTASLLRHPNICQVFDFGLTVSMMPYLVMEWIEGINLATKITQGGRMPVLDAIQVFQQIASALAFAHQHKVVHRDLKPENVMLRVDSQGRIDLQIVDFGIAKLVDDGLDWQCSALTQTGMVIGTPLFMSPEQARGLNVDGRSDIYSFGCLMYFVLTGSPPFVGKTLIDTINMHLNDDPPEIGSVCKVPNDLKRIVFKCLEKRRDDRYQSMDLLASDLRKLTKGISLERQPLSTEKRSRRKKLVVLLCFVLGFMATYTLSLILQNFLDSSSASSTHPGVTTERRTRIVDRH